MAHHEQPDKKHEPAPGVSTAAAEAVRLSFRDRLRLMGHAGQNLALGFSLAALLVLLTPIGGGPFTLAGAVGTSAYFGAHAMEDLKGVWSGQVPPYLARAMHRRQEKMQAAEHHAHAHKPHAA